MQDDSTVVDAREAAASSSSGPRRPASVRRRRRRAASLAVVAALALVASACIAEGSWELSDPVDPTIVPDWPWGYQDAPRFTDVSCPTSDFCMAIGQVTTDFPLVQVWDGEAWSEVEFDSFYDYSDPAFPELGMSSRLRAVSCLSPTDCRVAVTDVLYDGLDSGVYRWDGVDWQFEPGVGSDHEIGGFDCAPDGSCLIAWTSAWDGIQAYDGTSWGPQLEWDYGITSVACASGSQCLLSRTASGSDIVYLWEGGDIFSATVLAGPGWPVRDIECPAEDRCILVGEADDGVGGTRPAVAVWDGTTVTERPLPSAGGALTAVSCAQVIECVAVGAASTGEPVAFFSYNAWDFVATPTSPPAPTGTTIEELSCAPQVCVAVGWTGTTAASDLYAATYRWEPWPAEAPDTP